MKKQIIALCSILLCGYVYVKATDTYKDVKGVNLSNYCNATSFSLDQAIYWSEKGDVPNMNEWLGQAIGNARKCEDDISDAIGEIKEVGRYNKVSLAIELATYYAKKGNVLPANEALDIAIPAAYIIERDISKEVKRVNELLYKK